MPVFHIPSIGDRLEVAEDWTFNLYREHRNLALLQALGFVEQDRRYYYGASGEMAGEATIPEGTQLTVDRIYIRKGMPQFDSITFILDRKTCSDERISKTKGRPMRFWVKLADVNGVFFKEIESSR